MWLIELTYLENEGCSVLSEFWWALRVCNSLDIINYD